MILKKLVPIFMATVFTLSVAGCGSSEKELADSEQNAETTTAEVDYELSGDDGTEYFVSVAPGSSLTIRKTPGVTEKDEDDVLERLSYSQSIILADKHDNLVREDNYIWWEVYVSSSQKGWVASDFLSEEKPNEGNEVVVEDEEVVEEEALDLNDYRGTSRSRFIQEFGQPDQTVYLPGIEYNYYKNLSAVVCYNRLFNKDEIVELKIYKGNEISGAAK